MRSSFRFRVLVVPGLVFLALAGWALASPVGASPDDDYHMASIWCGLGEREGLCEPGAADGEQSVPAVLLVANCYAFDEELSGASCDLPDPSVLVSSTRGSFFDDGYPPLYYATMALFASSNIEGSIVAMRLANGALFVGLLTALIASLPNALRPLVAVPAVVTAVPLGVFIVASVNPSSWAITSALGLWIALVGWFRAESRAAVLRLGSLAAVLALMGAGARADSAAYNGIAILVALVLSARRDLHFAWRCTLPFALLMISVYFFVTSGQASVIVPSDAADSSETGRLLAVNAVLLPQLWHGVFGTWPLGWLDTPMPGVVWVFSAGVFAAFVFGGMARLGWRKALAFGTVLSALVAVPYWVSVRDGVVIGEGVQPRYVLPLVVMLAGVSLWTVARRGWLTRPQVLIAAALLSIAHSAALFINLRRYITGLDNLSLNLDVGGEWWWAIPVGPAPVFVVATVSFAGAVTLSLWRHLSPETSGRSVASSPSRKTEDTVVRLSLTPRNERASDT